MQTKNMHKTTKTLLLIGAGAVTGLANGFFGGGGGMIIVPALLLIAKQSVKSSHATALLVILPVSIVSGLFYINLSGFDWGLTLNVGLGVLAGGVIGSFLLKNISNRIITLLFTAVMAAAGIKLLFF